MAASYTPNGSVPEVPVKIADIEELLETALPIAGSVPFNSTIRAAFGILLPPGYKLRVQLEEDGRKKRSNAPASSWNPETGEIVFYFERPDAVPSPLPFASTAIAPDNEFFERRKAETASGIQQNTLPMLKDALQAQTTPASEKTISDKQIEELCMALSEAEKAGKSFIAFKWFRDTDLVNRGFTWTDAVASRQAVLTRAVEMGAVITASIPNPKSPSHPTTTVKLNRESKFAAAVAPRFQPIHAKGGASASEILLRDRGSY